MQIFVLILGTVLLSKAACALTCYQCIPNLTENCTQTTTVCPSNTQCGSFAVTSYAGGLNSSIKFRNCTTAAACINGSINLGFGDIVISSICCTSDLCNSQDAPVGSTPSPNGKQCFQCDGQVCNKTLNCNGNEDYCISTNVTEGGGTVIQKGCASKQICSSVQSLPIPGVIGKTSCCQGNLCNSASSTTAGLLLLVAPLISLIWIF